MFKQMLTGSLDYTDSNHFARRFFYNSAVSKIECDHNLYLQACVMHILVVEEDPIIPDILGVTLKKDGCCKTTTDSTETTLFELRHNQVVLVGLSLPDGDGTRLAHLIRKNHMPMPILVASGNSGIDDEVTHLVLVPMDI